MGCRCSDISDCQHDIQILQNTLGDMRRILYLYHSLQDRQGEIQRAEAQAYELKEECREQVQKTLQKHGAEGEQSMQQFDRYLEDKIDSLEHELDRMEREDERYHEEEEDDD